MPRTGVLPGGHVDPGDQSLEAALSREISEEIAGEAGITSLLQVLESGVAKEHGEWVEPRPMATTSLRLPAEVIDELKRQARARNIRYTSYVRSILERAAQGGMPPDLAEITKRLGRVEQAVTSRQAQDDQKTA